MSESDFLRIMAEHKEERDQLRAEVARLSAQKDELLRNLATAVAARDEEVARLRELVERAIPVMHERYCSQWVKEALAAMTGEKPTF